MARTVLPAFIENYDHKTDWFYEGEISARLVAHLKEKGYTILKDNSAKPSARGADIIARSPKGVKEIIEVKGYPTGYYTKGESIGRKNKTNPKLQAKHWFSEAMLSCFINHSNHRNSEHFIVALAFPLMKRYEELMEKVEHYFTDHNVPFKVYFVSDKGEVTTNNFHIHHR